MQIRYHLIFWMLFQLFLTFYKCQFLLFMVDITAKCNGVSPFLLTAFFSAPHLLTRATINSGLAKQTTNSESAELSFSSNFGLTKRTT
jgi:hypothetical protein